MRVHTKTVGDRTEAHLLAALLEHFDTVSLPFGENHRFDMLIEYEGRFLRVQCKTGRLRDGVISFATSSTTYHHPSNQGTRAYKHHYRGAADLFGVYCPANNGTYLIPVADVGITQGSLRLTDPRNNQLRAIRWARHYEIPAMKARLSNAHPERLCDAPAIYGAGCRIRTDGLSFTKALLCH